MGCSLLSQILQEVERYYIFTADNIMLFSFVLVEGQDGLEVEDVAEHTEGKSGR